MQRDRQSSQSKERLSLNQRHSGDLHPWLGFLFDYQVSLSNSLIFLYRFFSSEEISEGLSVVEFSLSAVENVPPGLQAAVDAVCGKDGQQGNVSRTIKSKNMF